eukprot:5428603-Alexandrium_andersonii.AAC.1
MDLPPQAEGAKGFREWRSGGGGGGATGADLVLAMSLGASRAAVPDVAARLRASIRPQASSPSPDRRC